MEVSQDECVKLLKYEPNIDINIKQNIKQTSSRAVKKIINQYQNIKKSNTTNT